MADLDFDLIAARRARPDPAHPAGRAGPGQRRRLERALREHAGPVLLDLRELTFMDSTGVRRAARGLRGGCARRARARDRRRRAGATRGVTIEETGIAALLPLVEEPRSDAASTPPRSRPAIETPARRAPRAGALAAALAGRGRPRRAAAARLRARDELGPPRRGRRRPGRALASASPADDPRRGARRRRRVRPGHAAAAQRDDAGYGGYGLFLVERMASRWGVERDDGTLVWFELDLAPPGAERWPAARQPGCGWSWRCSRSRRARHRAPPSRLRAQPVPAARCWRSRCARRRATSRSPAVVADGPRRSSARSGTTRSAATSCCRSSRVVAGSLRSPAGAPASARSRRRRAARAETERRQLLLLAEAARITDGAAHIDEALRRLVDLLVPAIADAAWIDVIGTDGVTRRHRRPRRGRRAPRCSRRG